MFENVLVESAGRLKTQSKFWTLGTFTLNSGILGLMILLPLMHPEALPKTAFTTMLIAPAPPPPPSAMPVAARPAAAQSSQTVAITAPSLIPRFIREDTGPPAVQPMGPMAPNSADNVASNNPLAQILGPSLAIHVARPPDHVRISWGVAAGNLIHQTQPVYPAIARGHAHHRSRRAARHHLEDWDDRESDRAERSADPASGRARWRAQLALQTISAQW